MLNSFTAPAGMRSIDDILKSLNLSYRQDESGPQLVTGAGGYAGRDEGQIYHPSDDSGFSLQNLWNEYNPTDAQGRYKFGTQGASEADLRQFGLGPGGGGDLTMGGGSPIQYNGGTYYRGGVEGQGVDPSGTKYDPTYGYLTPASTWLPYAHDERQKRAIKDASGFWNGMGPWALGASLFALPVAAAAGASSAAAGSQGGAYGLSEGTIGQIAKAGVTAAGSTMNGGSPLGAATGLAGSAIGSGLGGATDGAGNATDASWGVNPRGDSMDFNLDNIDGDNWNPDFGGNTYDPNVDYSNPYGLYQAPPDTGADNFDPKFGGQAYDPNNDYISLLHKLQTTPGQYGTGASLLSKLLGGAGGTAGGGSVLSRILGGNFGGGDIGSLLGGLGSSALGFMGARDQMQGYKDMQNKYFAMGQPYRDRLNASYQPGFDLASQDPAYQGALDQSSNSILRKLSAQGGNPYDNPGGLMEANKYVAQNTALPQLNTYRSQLGTFGQFGTNQAGTAQSAAIQAGAGQYNALGAGLAGLTNPYGNLNLNMGGGY